MSISKAFSRRPLLGAIAGMALACALPLAHAQAAFPSKPITMVVPYPAGGANDMLGRLIGQKMGEALGGTAVVDNKPGAGALLGAGLVARAPADGHTLLVGGLATHAASPNLLKADYDPLKDFEPIGMIGSAPIIVITATDSPYKTLKDVVEAARKDPQGIMYGSSGNGSPLHLAGELFLSIAKVNMTHVPYKGGNAHIIDLIGGRVPVIFDTATNSMPLLRGGKVRALAVGSAKRLPDQPDVPTLAEAGVPVGFHLSDSGYLAINAMWGGKGRFEGFGRRDPLDNVLSDDRAIHDTMASMIVHQVFSRHPKLKVCSIENGSYFVYRLIKRLKKSANNAPYHYQEDPVEQLKNNVWIAPYYEDDVKLLAATIGVDRILFGSDWPHGEGLADPTSFTADIPQFPEFSYEDTRKVMRDNALDLVGLNVTAAAT